MDPTRDNLSRMGDSIFKVLGNDIIAQFRIANLSAGRIVVDGLRYQDELDRYKTAKGFKLIGIVAPTEARYERSIMTGAAMKDKGLTREKFALSATVRSEQEVPLLIQQADQIIENNLDVTALHSKIDYIMTTWKQL
jgi:dephospho-CoA kinase